MKSFKQYIKESTALMDLINKHDDPFSFLADAMKMLSDGTLKLKKRGAANARELVNAWNKSKKKKIMIGEAVEYISERKQNFVKGWTFKDKIVTSTKEFGNYHINQVFKQPKKFGLDEKKIIKILDDGGEVSPKEVYYGVLDGTIDNNVYIEEYLFKKGYCMFVVDKEHGRVEGWDEKSCKLGAKAVDDNYLPYERDEFKLFEIKPVKGRPKYITNKLDFNDFVGGKKERKYVSPMAQFRESSEK